MHITTLKAETTSTVQSLWSLLTQVKHWPTWDPELQEVELPGSFKQGNSGNLVYQDGTLRNFTVVKLQVHESLVLALPYQHKTELLVKWDLRATGPQVTLEQDVTLSGPFLTKMMLKGHQDPLSKAALRRMEKLLKLAEGSATERNPLSGGQAQRAH